MSDRIRRVMSSGNLTPNPKSMIVAFFVAGSIMTFPRWKSACAYPDPHMDAAANSTFAYTSAVIACCLRYSCNVTPLATPMTVTNDRLFDGEGSMFMNAP